jgi:hypothetical protein
MNWNENTLVKMRNLEHVSLKLKIKNAFWKQKELHFLKEVC